MTTTITGFHGTNTEFETFIPSTVGTIGAGIYLAGTPSQASVYGEIVIKADVKMKSPWIVSLMHDSDAAYEHDLDSPCVEAVLTLPNAMHMIGVAKDTCGLFNADLTNELIKLGYDGVIGTYPDGSKEIVAFSADQVIRHLTSVQISE